MKKKLAEELEEQVDQLRSVIAQAGEDKKILEAELGNMQNAVNILREKLNLFTLEMRISITAD